MKYKIEPKDYEEIISLYLKGKSSIEISKIYKVSKVTICRILNKNNIPIRRNYKYNYEDSIFEEMVIKYNNGEKIKQISKNYNIPTHIIKHFFKLKGIKLRENRLEFRIYPINENYFDEIDTNSKAYFLGLLFADGCNTGKTISISLSNEEDAKILEFFSKEIYQCNKPLKVNKTKYKLAYRFAITNKHMCNKLINYGMIPNKSLKLKYPNGLNDNLFFSFLLGYFDGDGCARIIKGHKKDSLRKVTFSILGTQDFLIEIKNKINQLLKLDYDIKIYKNKNTHIYELRIIAIDDVYKLFKAMYSENNIFFERKYNKFYEIFEERRKNNEDKS